MVIYDFFFTANVFIDVFIWNTTFDSLLASIWERANGGTSAFLMKMGDRRNGAASGQIDDNLCWLDTKKINANW